MSYCFSLCHSHHNSYTGDNIKNGKLYQFCRKCSHLTKTDNIPSSDKKVSVVIYTSHEGDLEKAFYTHGSSIFDCPSINALEVLSKTYLVFFGRVKEITDFDSILKMLKPHEVDHITIGGHGDGDGLQLGNFYLQKNDSSKLSDIFMKISKILNENGILLFDSCHVGKEGGLAQTVSRILNNPLVIAPDTTSIGWQKKFYLADPKHIYTDPIRIAVIIMVVFPIFFGLSKCFSLNNAESTIVGFFAAVLVNVSNLFARPVQIFFTRIPSFLSMVSGIQMNYRNGRLQK